MAANDMIDSILSQTAIDQFALLKQLTNEAVTNMAALSQAARTASDGLASNTTLKDQITQANNLTAANKGVIDTTSVLNTIRKQSDDILARHNGHSQEYVKVLKDTAIAHKTATQETILLTKEQERQDAIAQKVAANLIKQKGAWAELTKQYADAAKIARDLGAEYAAAQLRGEEWTESQVASMKEAEARALQLRTAMKGINKGIGDNSLNVGNYPTVAAELSAIKEQMLQIELATKKDGEQMTILAEKAKVLKQNLSSPSSGMSGGTAFTSMTTELNMVNAEMVELKAKTVEDQEQFERLAMRVAELKEAIASVGLAVTEVAEKGEMVNVAFEKVGETLKEIGKFALAFFGMQLGMEFIGGISEEFEKADNAARKLTNTLENNGAKGALNEINEEVEKITSHLKYLDEYEVQGVFDKLITYGKLTKEQMEDLIPVIINYSAKEKISVEEGAATIIKAMEGNARALKSYGINIKDAATETGKAATPAERLGLIMKELKPRVEGAADAFGNSFGGKIEGLKRDIKELELSIADFFVKLAGIERESIISANVAKTEADNAQKLVNEYGKLSEKVNQSSEDKKRLSEITTSLVATFGNSVIAIDEETGATRLNIEATQDLIRQKLLLANSSAGGFAMQYHGAEKSIKENAEQYKLALEQFTNAQKNAGETYDQIVNKMSARSKGGNIVNHITPQEEDIVHLHGMSEKYKDAINKFTKARDEALEKFLGTGFEKSDLEKLFPESSDIKKRGDLNDNGSKQKINDNYLALEKERSTLTFEEYKLRAEKEAETQKNIYENELNSYDMRLEALKKFNELQNQIRLNDISTQWSNQKLTIEKLKQADNESKADFELRKINENKKLDIIDEKYNAQLLANMKDNQASEKKLADDWYNYELGLMKRVDDGIKTKEADELQANKTRYEAGLIKEEAYKANIAAIGKKWQLAELIANKGFLEELLKQAREAGIDTTKIDAALNDTNNKIKSSLSDKTSPVVDPNKKKLQDLEWEAVGKAISTTKELMDDYYNSEIQHLEEKKKLIDDAYNLEVAGINASFKSQQQKDIALKVLAGQKAQDDKRINDEIKREKQKMAEADRVAAIIEIAEKTAIAVMSAMSIPVYGQAMAAVIATMGAAEIGLVLAKPMPQYRYGTKTQPGGVHPGGPALVGEDYRPELVLEPGKDPYFISSPTVKDFAADTRVIPESELLASSLGMMTPQLLGMVMGGDNDFSALQGTLRQEMGQVRKAIENKKETHIGINERGFKMWVKAGDCITNKIAGRFN